MRPDRPVSNWLFLLCIMVFGMVVGGGHARTINAGFSIQVWQPFTGFIPPLSTAAWARQFALYQHTALYQSHPISLTTYKSLFWPMFLDRCWGRLMALVFAIPFAIFWVSGRISHRLALWLLAIFAAGGAEAAFGWYMVLTGLQPGVLSPPPVWAAPHFCAAMLILAALLATAVTLRNPNPAPAARPALRHALDACIALLFLTLGLGALVAANNAVTVYNTFPLMNGQLIPAGLFAPGTQFITSQTDVQFFHRLLATLTALTVVATAGLGLRDNNITGGQRDLFLLFGALTALQYLLGMVTIVLGSAQLGFIHELNAVLLFATAILLRANLRAPISFEQNKRSLFYKKAPQKTSSLL